MFCCLAADFISHSMSREQLKFIFCDLLPDLSGKTVLDIGSRMGPVLYAVSACIWNVTFTYMYLWRAWLWWKWYCRTVLIILRVSIVANCKFFLVFTTNRLANIVHVVQYGIVHRCYWIYSTIIELHWSYSDVQWKLHFRQSVFFHSPFHYPEGMEICMVIMEIFECKARPSFKSFQVGGGKMTKYENKGTRPFFSVHKRTISRGSGGMLSQESFTF